jgi:hypothetical protein
MISTGEVLSCPAGFSTLVAVRWRPLSIRDRPDAAESYEALHDGLPDWLTSGAARWVEQTLEDAPYGFDLTRFLHTLEQFLRLPLNWRGGVQSAFHDVLSQVAGAGDRALDILDGVLMLTSNWPNSDDRQVELHVMLTIGGSAWKIGMDEDGRPALERRVDEVSEQAARDEIDEPGNAGHHLQAAWHSLYGRNPDPSAAYREAVRAVEAAAKPVILPSDRTATLGKMIRALNDKPDKWISELGTVADLTITLAELWRSQSDRHGTDDESLPLSVSALQAEAAVHLAVTLVHWFRVGAVRRS